MYDYLAKIILLGPSGTGKYVYPPSLGLTRAPLADLSPSPLPRTLPVRQPCRLCYMRAHHPLTRAERTPSQTTDRLTPAAS